MVQETKQFFSRKAGSYARYIDLFLYPQGFRAFFAGAEWLADGLRVLDAGCGTGVVTFGLLKALNQRGYQVESINAFDLTPAMLELFRAGITARAIKKIELAQANVLELAQLPSGWHGYDLIISSAMLEYIPKDSFPATLANLRALLKEHGRFILFITRKNWLTEMLVERPWGGNRYTGAELLEAFVSAGFTGVSLKKFPLNYGWLNFWGLIVEGRF